MGVEHTSEYFLTAYDSYADAIFRHCYFRVFSRERAQELTQDVFMRTWEYLAQGKSIENIRAFLYRVATNLIIDESRKKKDVSLGALQEKGFDAPSSHNPARTHAMLDGKFAKEVLMKLDPMYRDVVLMRYMNDLTPKEIAQALGESENVVSVRIHRGLKQLREKLG